MNTGTLVLGLINGLTIGLLAVGFVMVFRANRFLNLAHAQLGAVSALLLAKVVNDWNWGWWPSVIGCIAVGVGTGLIVERFTVSVVRRKSKAPVRLMMLTIGVSDILLAITYIPWLTPTSQAPYPEPFNSDFSRRRRCPLRHGCTDHHHGATPLGPFDAVLVHIRSESRSRRRRTIPTRHDCVVFPSTE